MDQHLGELLRSIVGSDPDGDLDDNQREAVMYAMLGILSEEKLRAVWKFAGSICDESRRSSLLHKLVPKIPVFGSRLAKRVADSIPEPYWRYSSVIDIASEFLKFGRAGGRTDKRFREEAWELIREAEANIPLVAEDDRSSIVWEAGLTLVEAGELDWAEKLAESNSYCPENTEVLLSVAKMRASQGEKDRALQTARKVAALASNGREDLTNRAYDLEDVADLAAELGETVEARGYLDAALRLALESQAEHDIDGSKCVVGIAVSLCKQGDIDAAREAANKITIASRRDYALQQIEGISAPEKRNPG